MEAWMTVDCPGARTLSRALALTQPHETRTLEIWTGLPVLLVTRKGCDRVGPRTTGPKSAENSSNMASAQEPAMMGDSRQRAAPSTRMYRNILKVPLRVGGEGPAALRSGDCR